MKQEKKEKALFPPCFSLFLPFSVCSLLLSLFFSFSLSFYMRQKKERKEMERVKMQDNEARKERKSSVSPLFFSFSSFLCLFSLALSIFQLFSLILYETKEREKRNGKSQNARQ